MTVETTKNYRKLNGPATICQKYYVRGGRIYPKKDTIKCEFEKTDRYHRYSCKFFDHISGMCRYDKFTV